MLRLMLLARPGFSALSHWLLCSNTPQEVHYHLIKGKQHCHEKTPRAHLSWQFDQPYLNLRQADALQVQSGVLLRDF